MHEIDYELVGTVYGVRARTYAYSRVRARTLLFDLRGLL
jgi:hypothetical protein